MAEQLLEYARITRGLRVIELTFGPARLAWHLEAECCHVERVDLAVYGKEPLPAEWRRGFDVALVTSALHQAADPEGLIADVACCVRPGGLCAGLEPGYSELEPRQLERGARSAGLALVEVDERQSGAALFWKGLVPSLRVLPGPPSEPLRRPLLPLAA